MLHVYICSFFSVMFGNFIGLSFKSKSAASILLLWSMIDYETSDRNSLFSCFAQEGCHGNELSLKKNEWGNLVKAFFVFRQRLQDQSSFFFSSPAAHVIFHFSKVEGETILALGCL